MDFIIVSDTHARMSPFLYTKSMLNSTVCVRSASSVLCVCLRRKRVAYAYRTHVWIPATISWHCLCLFEHGNVQLTWVSDTHAWMFPHGLRHAYVSLSLSGCPTEGWIMGPLVRDRSNTFFNTCYNPPLLYRLSYGGSDHGAVGAGPEQPALPGGQLWRLQVPHQRGDVIGWYF